MANSPAYGLSTFALTTASSTGNTTVFSNALTGATEFTIDGYGNVTSASNTIVGRSLVFSDGSVMSTAGGASARFAYTGDGVTTTYSTGNYSATTTLNTNVYISGVYQNKDQYSWSGTTITFLQPPPAGLAIEIMITTINYSTTIPVPGSVGPSTLTVGGPTWYPNGNVATTGNLLVGNTLVFSDGSTLTSSAVYATRFTYTGDGVTTTFSTGNYNATTVNNTNIYIGSIYQLKSQYTWTGTTITFTQAPPNGASIEIMLNVLNSTTIVPAQASVTPSTLSTGGPSWDVNGNLTITGNLWSTGTSASYFAGNVGIATSPTYRLDVTDQNNAMMRLTQYSDVDGAVIRGFRAKGTIAAPLAVVADNVLTGFRAFGWTSSAAFSPLSAAINIRAAEAFTSSASGSYIDFSTTATGTTVPVERMRINPNGNVGIATTSPTAPLHVFGTNTGTGQSSQGAIIGRFMDGLGRNSVTINGGIDGTAPATNAALNIGGGASLSYSLSTTHGANMSTAFAGTTNTGLAVGGYVGIGTGTANYPLQVRRVGGAGSLGINIDNYLAIGDASTLHYAIADTTTQPTSHIFFTRNSTAVDNAAMFIRPNGSVTKPLQPAWYAGFAGFTCSSASVQYTPTNYNQGVNINVTNSFITSTGIFTAPTAGVYLLFGSFLRNGGALVFRGHFQKNGANCDLGEWRTSEGFTGYNESTSHVALVSAAVGDQLKWTISCDTAGGQIYTSGYNYFGGYLLG